MSEATRYRFSIEEYERMGEAGILTEDDRVELVAGEIVCKPVIGPRHAEGVRRCTMAFARSPAGDVALVSVQNPVRLPTTQSEPEPGVALLRPRDRGYGDRHPNPDEVLLIVEVATRPGAGTVSRRFPCTQPTAYQRSGSKTSTEGTSRSTATPAQTGIAS